MTTEYDLFVSYARADNGEGWIEGFLEALAEQFRELTGGRELRWFFDREDIRNFSHWESEIFLKGLTRSKLFLAFLSPSYFASEVCRREWRAWVEQEIAKHVLTQGAAPLYIVEVPALFGKPMPGEHEVARQVAQLCGIEASPRFITEVSPVVREFRRRQMHAAVPFYRQGLEALQREDLRRELRRLAEDIDDRVEVVRRASESESTVPPYNRHFTGRLDELVELRGRLVDNQAGVIAGIHGLGGIGKTELALTYAHAYAGVYPGGRFYLPCEFQTDLRRVALRLGDAPAFAPHISDEERKNPDDYFAAVVRVLKQRLDKLGHVLLVLDNVNEPGLLSRQQADCLTTLGGKLHLLATTRLAPGGWRNCLTLGEMKHEDALAMLEKFRPFADDSERAAAEDIVRKLGGFALAIELVAARLSVRKSATYAGVAKGLGLEKLDTYAEDKNVELRRHNHEKRLERVLGPALAELSPQERRAMEFAAMLPADRVSLPWLRELVAADFPQSNEPGPDGEDAWEELVESLIRLAVLAPIEEETTSRRQARVHRLVQELVGRELAPEDFRRLLGRIDALMRARLAELERVTNWQEAAWELEPLDALARLWDEAEYPGRNGLLNQTANWWDHVAQWARAEPLYRRTLAVNEADFGVEHPDVATNLNNLGMLLHATNRLTEAEAAFGRMIAICERLTGPEQGLLATGLNNLAELLRATNRLSEAEPLYRRALDIWERHLAPDHPQVAAGLNNLGILLYTSARMVEAEPLFRRAIKAFETALGLHHPRVAAALNNLAALLRATGRLEEAEPLLERALRVNESALGPNHPDVARALNNLAELFHSSGRLAQSEPMYRKAVSIWESSLGPDHPSLAMGLNNLAGVLRESGRLDEAEPMYRRALAIYTASLGPDHPDVALCLNNIAEVLKSNRRLEEAEPLLRRAIAIWERSLGPDHPQLEMGLTNLAMLLFASNRPDEAEPLFVRGLTLLLRFLQATGHKHPHLHLNAENYAFFLLKARGLTQEQATARMRDVLTVGGGEQPPGAP